MGGIVNRAALRSVVGTVVVALLGAGLAFAGSQGGHRIGDVPIYGLCVAVAFLLQWIAFVPAWRNRTEKFYDLTGGITYITVTLLAVLLTPGVDTRSLLL
jgi:hypothetical protein